MHILDGMICLLGALPPELVRSVTPDRGKEFAKHDEISAALHNVPFFFPPSSRSLDARNEREHQ